MSIKISICYSSQKEKFGFFRQMIAKLSKLTYILYVLWKFKIVIKNAIKTVLHTVYDTCKSGLIHWYQVLTSSGW